MFTRIHHIAIICSDYEKSRDFYVNKLGLTVASESYRESRRSHKLNLSLPDGSELELFSFPSPPRRPSYPEACGLRHLAFAVTDLGSSLKALRAVGIMAEEPRIDDQTGCRFAFFSDPDGLPIELYEIPDATVGPAAPPG